MDTTHAFNMWYVKLQIHRFDANTFDMRILKGTRIVILSWKY